MLLPPVLLLGFEVTVIVKELAYWPPGPAAGSALKDGAPTA